MFVLFFLKYNTTPLTNKNIKKYIVILHVSAHYLDHTYDVFFID